MAVSEREGGGQSMIGRAPLRRGVPSALPLPPAAGPAHPVPDRPGGPRGQSWVHKRSVTKCYCSEVPNPPSRPLRGFCPESTGDAVCFSCNQINAAPSSTRTANPPPFGQDGRWPPLPRGGGGLLLCPSDSKCAHWGPPAFGPPPPPPPPHGPPGTTAVKLQPNNPRVRPWGGGTLPPTRGIGDPITPPFLSFSFGPPRLIHMTVVKVQL